MSRVHQALSRAKADNNVLQEEPKSLEGIGKLTVTILGKSGSGKTVFLASLYAHLASGVFGFSAAADDKTDRALGGYLDRLYLENEPPAGTQENEVKYFFSLMFEGRPIADIDCFDYRGGATDDAAESEAGKLLAQRIAASDIIIWLIDLAGSKEDLASRRVRLRTGLRRLSSICSQAVRSAPRLRVWCFVRTKVDKDFPELTSEDLQTATLQLAQHLGDVVAVSMYEGVAYASLVSIAPIGRAAVRRDRIIAGDQAVNVEWPLLTSLGFLIKSRLDAINEAQDTSPPPSNKKSFFRRAGYPTDGVSPVDAISDADKEREVLERVLARIQEKTPESVKLLNSVVGQSDASGAET